MISWRKLIILFVFYLCPTITIAYEVKTHEFITSYSTNRSELVDPSSNLLSSLGFEHNIFSKNQKFPNSRGEQSTIFELIKFGSRFEDNTDELLRPLNHFYDPQNEGRPLTILLFGELGINSFDWILEERTPIPSDQQNFSYSDANNYLKAALTSLEIGDRESNWGLTFQTLGQVVHHIQDMAQPQHVRNDAHCNEPQCALILKYRPSLYELITAKSQSRLENILESNQYPDIDLNVFNTAGSFWDSEAPNSVSGLAEFTSTNFVSAGTNFEGGVKSGSTIINVGRDSEYPSPGTDNLTFTTQSILGLLGPDLPGEIQFVETQVTDTYDPSKSQANQRASSFSIFDSNLESTHIGRIFSLNIFNYDAAHEFLIPRAVAYSAGLIDYFFRGRIEAAITADGDGIEITNTSNGGVTDPASPTTFQAGGAFEVFYVTNSGEHKEMLSLTNLALGSNLPVNNIHTITGLNAALDGISDLGDEGKIIVLFDGDIGSERGLATTNLDLGWNATVVYFINIYDEFNRLHDVFEVGIEFNAGVTDIDQHPTNLTIKIEGLNHVFEADTFLNYVQGTQGDATFDPRFWVTNYVNSSARSRRGAYLMGHDSPYHSLAEFANYMPTLGVTRARVAVKLPTIP